MARGIASNIESSVKTAAEEKNQLRASGELYDAIFRLSIDKELL